VSEPARTAAAYGAAVAGAAAAGPPVVVPAPTLTAFAAALLERAGAPAATAGVVAASLVSSDLLGHDSHGVRRLIPYVGFVRAGQIDPAATPVVAGEDRATAVVDGRRGFGQPAARLATEVAARLAREHGTGAVAIRRANHVGRLGEWVGALAGEGLVALAVCNADPTVAPHGGRGRRLGTNPLAWAAPRAAGRLPIVMDWATAAMAEGKLAVALARGEEVPAGVVVDAEGRPSTRPAAFYDGGALLPFAGHKGSGLSIMIELVGGLLSGAGASCLPGYDGTNGTVLIALDVARFVDEAAFRRQAEALCAELAATPHADGHDEVLVPGEPEARTEAQRRRDGIPVAARTWGALGDLAGELGAEVPATS
jgi:LDH2 family malate/lactate/ureidoglycolate dehydrogenase